MTNSPTHPTGFIHLSDQSHSAFYTLLGGPGHFLGRSLATWTFFSILLTHTAWFNSLLTCHPHGHKSNKLDHIFSWWVDKTHASWTYSSSGVSQVLPILWVHPVGLLSTHSFRVSLILTRFTLPPILLWVLTLSPAYSLPVSPTFFCLRYCLFEPTWGVPDHISPDILVIKSVHENIRQQGLYNPSRSEGLIHVSQGCQPVYYVPKSSAWCAVLAGLHLHTCV